MEAAKSVKRTVISKSFLLFLLTGGFAAVVNWSSRILFNLWMPFSAAIVIAYICGMVTAYVLAKLFVFKTGTQSTTKSVLFFTLVNLVAIAQTWLVSVGLAYFVLPWLGLHNHVKEFAHLIGVMVPVFTSYAGHKRWSFKTE
jgi:putative flippase GtrA